MTSRWHRIGCLLLLFGWHLSSGAAEKKPADAWLEGSFKLPAWFSTNQFTTPRFEQLKADGIAGKLRATWRPTKLDTNATVTLWISADEPDHWPARDWRSHRMEARGQVWDVAVPVENVDVPLVYFVASVEGSVTNLSRLRLCKPREAGLEEPTRLPWAFLEGFEERIEGWWVVADEPDFNAIKNTTASHTGKNAAVVKLPARKASVTVATTKVRGWQAIQQGASGVRIWLRTGGGEAKLRAVLHAHAGSPEQALAICSLDVTLKEQWQQVDLPFAAFPGLSLAGVDLLTLEFVSNGATEFFLDDLQLLSRWKRN